MGGLLIFYLLRWHLVKANEVPKPGPSTPSQTVSAVLKPVHMATIVADFGGNFFKRRLSPNSATVWTGL